MFKLLSQNTRMKQLKRSLKSDLKRANRIIDIALKTIENQKDSLKENENMIKFSKNLLTKQAQIIEAQEDEIFALRKEQQKDNKKPGSLNFN